MGLLKRRTPKKLERLNLIPILDAVFIFIFFLLMSAQFLDVYEIGSDAPAMKMVKENDDKKKPLNLKLKIYSTKIVITTGPEDSVYKNIKTNGEKFDYIVLNKILAEIKKKNLKESSIILKPQKNINYKTVVQIIDQVRYVKSETKGISQMKMFDQVMFENNI